MADVGENVRKTLNTRNNIYCMVAAGSKGSNTNLSQVRPPLLTCWLAPRSGWLALFVFSLSLSHSI